MTISNPNCWKENDRGAAEKIGNVFTSGIALLDILKKCGVDELSFRPMRCRVATFFTYYVGGSLTHVLVLEGLRRIGIISRI